MAKDYLGKPLEIGDAAVFMGLHYRDFTKGKIIKITPKTLLIEFQDGKWTEQVKQFHNQVIRIESC